ncbi:MAG: hypothetical protein ACC651_06165 [Candidatus Scalindua sp.]
MRKQVVKLQISNNKSQTLYNDQQQKPLPDKRRNSEIIKQVVDHRAIPIKPGTAWSLGIRFWNLFEFWSLFIVISPET